ncbi:sensor histidine kinase [Leucobacter sp. USHLN153]|uniref:sensor histidine kinase n=1 Tax=Leucobacter sp. USHLN153 TaxID=3081268 RepID=UPI00301AB9E8
MEPTLLVLAATALGILVGAATTLAIVGARAAGVRRSNEMRPELPEIATAILDEVDAFAVILDSALAPVYVNAVARDERHLSDAELQDTHFLARVRKVMTTGIPDTHDPDPADPSDTVRIHIVRLQQRFVVILAEDLGEEQRVNAMRRDFIANVSHELKTPISAIGLLSEAVQQAADEPVLVRDFAKSLVKESRRLGALSRDIIQLSEAQSTLRPEDREPVALRDLVQAEVDSHRSFAEQHRVELVVTADADPERDATILGRPTSLSAAVANLLSNAIRHSPEGGRVGIGMHREKKRFVVAITDQGDGIAPEHLPRIFERFYRVDGARTRGEGGTGLGLSIARHTMRAHGGDVDVWSQQGVGSTFTLSFPLTSEKGSSKSAKRMKQAKRVMKDAERAAKLAPPSPSPDSAPTPPAPAAP